eukprot:CAMPEP_0171570558 /NCGR_PEP_ID=MMETSP0961-20121227/3025_1 /TAXON_ID=87120 /ORGANISM="Aurantiochytrium limacinum, Strain ATCCMYA-1381" /LENGTH=51 /DNA_ID=CAMNT_0012125089 /DNA_START=360 /DNA_END=515 /DNA_ORIENTATION=+
MTKKPGHLITPRGVDFEDQGRRSLLGCGAVVRLLVAENSANSSAIKSGRLT